MSLDNVCKEDLEIRQSNISEYFHWKLCFSFEYYFPKMVSFVEKLKKTIGSYYNNINIVPNDKKIKNTFEDTHKFLEDFKNENVKNFRFDYLFELNNENAIRTETIIINNMKCFFGLINVEGIEDENVLKNIYDYDFIEDILPSKYSLNDEGQEIIIKNNKENDDDNINFEEISKNVQNEDVGDYFMETD